MSKKGRYGWLLLVAVLLGASVAAYINLSNVTDAYALLNRSQEVLTAERDLLSTMQDMETGQRGFLITGQEAFLEPYRDGRARLQPALVRLRDLTLDNARQRALLDTLQQDVDATVAILDETLGVFRNQGPDAAKAAVSKQREKLRMDAVRAQLGEMHRIETERYLERAERVDHSCWLALTEIVVAALTGIVAIYIAWRQVRHEFNAEQRMRRLLHERMEWYRTTLGSIGDGVVATDDRSIVTYLNPVAEKLTGWTLAESEGRPIQELFHIVNEFTGNTVDNPLTDVFKTKAVRSLAHHTVLIAKDGTRRPVEDSAAPIFNIDDELVGGVLVFRDVSEARAATLAVLESEDRYRSLITATAQMVWTTDANGSVSEDSPTWREFTGQSYEQFKGWGWLDAVHPDDRERAKNTWERALRDRSLYQLEYRLRRHDGAYRHTHVRSVPVLKADGSVREWVGMNIDITERKLAEIAVQESEERFRQVAEMTCEWIWEQEPSGRFIYSNQGVKLMLGYEPHELIGRHYSELIADERPEHSYDVFPADGMITQSFFAVLNYYRHKHGHTVITESTGGPVMDSNGQLIRWRGVDYDITQQVRAAAERSRLAAIVESSSDAVIGKNLQGIITDWNAAAERIFGYTAAEVVGQPLAILCPPEYGREIDSNLDRIRVGAHVEHYETMRRRKSGELLPVSISVAPIRDDSDRVIGASETTRDISERVRAAQEREALLDRAQEAREVAESATRAKDEFLALVSHELRTPLNAMYGWIRVLEGQGDGIATEMLQKATQAICRNIEVQRQLIDDLLDSARIVSGKLKIDMQAVDLAAVIEAAVDVVRPAARSKEVQLTTHLPTGLRRVAGDPMRLQQVIWNLLSNAVKFTSRGGRVDLTLEDRGAMARIIVSDSGKGIAKEFLPYVFQRYTQATEKNHFRHSGLGLGLALVWHLVELHGGKVTVASAGEGQGTQFFVDLPVQAVPLRDSLNLLQSPELDDVLIEGARILVVDDHESARLLLADVLSSRGCVVHTVGCGAEALSWIEAQADADTDAIVCDIGLPDMDGYEVMRRIRAWEHGRSNGGTCTTVRPLAAIALTAYGRPEDRILALRSGFQMHLAKPVEPAELLVVLATLLRGYKVNPKFDTDSATHARIDALHCCKD